METRKIRKATAKDGCVWKLKDSDELLSSVLYLGKDDNIDRYEQVLEVAEEEQSKTKEE